MIDADTLETVRRVVAAVEDKRGFEVVVMNVSELTSIADAFVICSGAHDRQVGAIADEIGRQLRAAGRRPLHVEGERRAEWVLMDYGDVVVHLFTEDRRAFYGLDSLWADAPRVADAELDLGSGAAADADA
jgi:ribosome-associated protein